ncbi:hypothetical protein POM88_030992 [Heracleum sosnowskyi]|uniref:Remorin C-terminal domain-containing protein n=1 Tax=Heracleum sosnowskyi TaxID=360622 RepID=A0AAD8HWK8_9APIA|nr:hypothetical protein POM88_030992 [Heracleum sosnowskyi]
MAKVYPCKPSSSCSTSGKTYTIWMKSLVANGNGFTVYDSFGKVVYRIDNYSNKCCKEVYLMDLHGNTLFSMFQKKFFGFGQWNGYNKDTKVKNEKPWFEVKNSSKFLKRRETEYRVTMGFDSTSFYKIKGIEGKSEFSIIDNQGRVVAEVKQKQSSSGVLLGQDVLSLKLEPLVDDHSFIMALVAVHGLLNRKMHLKAAHTNGEPNKKLDKRIIIKQKAAVSMDEVPSSEHSPDEVSASKRSPVHENAVAEDHALNKGAENKGTDDAVAEDHAPNKGAENKGTTDDAVAEVHALNKGAENKGTDDSNKYAEKEGTDDSNDRVAALTRVETEKRLAFIKAWEEKEKTKAENKAYKKKSAIGAWENTKKALVEVQLEQIEAMTKKILAQIEEELEKKKAEKLEKFKNKIAIIHQKAEEKRAAAETERGKKFLKIDEKGAKLREMRPRKFCGYFGCS